MKLERHNG
jgi:hypothetical protein